MKYVPAILALLVVTAIASAPASAAYSGEAKVCSEQKESILEQAADYLGFVPSLGTTMKCATAGAMTVGCFTVSGITVVAVFTGFPGDEVISFKVSAIACSAATAQRMVCTASYAADGAQNAGQEAVDDLQDATNSCSA